jgi:hypothetical protein
LIGIGPFPRYVFRYLTTLRGIKIHLSNIAPGLIMTDRLIAIRAKGLGITVDEQPASAAHGA